MIYIDLYGFGYDLDIFCTHNVTVLYLQDIASLVAISADVGSGVGCQ